MGGLKNNQGILAKLNIKWWRKNYKMKKRTKREEKNREKTQWGRIKDKKQNKENPEKDAQEGERWEPAQLCLVLCTILHANT